MERLEIEIGKTALFNNETVVITRLVDLNRVTIEEINSGIIHTVNLNELRPMLLNKASSLSKKAVHALNDKELKRANKRFQIIEPILSDRKNLDLIKEIAKKNKVHFTTIYRWLKIYDENGTLSSLAGANRPGGKGKSRLDPELDEIIMNTIDEVYLNGDRRSIKRTIRTIQSRCKNREINSPHPNTIRNRIKSISRVEQMQKRFGRSAARDKFEPIKSSFPGANHPLSVVDLQ